MIAAGLHRLALPAGYQLGKYRLREVLGSGGFGITYLADDASLKRRVAIKELLPNDIATRLDGTTVVAKTQSEEESLAWARERFVDEGRALAACDHPNVVHVYEMIEANGTAYMVTKFEEGRSLDRWLRELGRAPTEAELRSVLLPLLSGLETVHRAGFLHRDIKPDNIYLTTSGRPVLLDFGSARQAITTRSMVMTTIVTAGYAPFEQYHEDGHQGPWSDIYALAAVIYRAIVGKKPPEAVRRLKDDPCVRLARDFSGQYGAHFLSAIDKALAVEPGKRPRTIVAWREMIGDAPPPAGRTSARSAASWTASATRTVRDWQRKAEPLLQRVRANPAVAIGVTSAVIIAGAILWKLAQPQPAPRLASVATPSLVTPTILTPLPSTPRVATPPPSTPAPASTPVSGASATPAPPAPASRLGPRAGEKWQNSLGMTFAPIAGSSVHLSVFATRRADFEAFVNATDYDATAGVLSYSSGGWKGGNASWPKPGFAQKPDHPVVGVSAYDAVAFCRWLTETERTAGAIDASLAYRLPTDDEWSAAAGGTTYPWGDAWPPPRDVGNFAGAEASGTLGSRGVVPGYRDKFAGTAPVGSFAPNAQGFHDLGGNVLEWCETWYRKELNTPELRQRDPTLNFDAGGASRLVQRGASCFSSTPESLRLQHRSSDLPATRAVYAGFRCVLGPVAPALLPWPQPALVEKDEEEIPEGGDAAGDVDPKLIGIWECKGAGGKGPWTQRWQVAASGQFRLEGPLADSGTLTAGAGRIRQISDTTNQPVEVTYEFRSNSTLTTDGPFGPATWKRISSVRYLAGTRSSNDAPGTVRRSSRGADRPARRPTVERKVRDIGNSIRRRFGF